MGFWTGVAGKLVRGPAWLTVEERLEASKLVRKSHRAQKLKPIVVSRIEQHRVTRALKTEGKMFDLWKSAAKSGLELAKNNEFEDLQIMKIISHILKLLERAAKVTGNQRSRLQELVKEFDKVIAQSIEEAEKEYDIPFRDVMRLISQTRSTAKQTANQFRTLFKGEVNQGLLARFAIRTNLRDERTEWVKLMDISQRLEILVKELEHSAVGKDKEKRVNKLEAELRVLIKRDREAMKHVFYYAYLVKRRDFLILLAILNDVTELNAENRMWVSKYLIPRSALDKAVPSERELRRAMEEELQVIAQGFRVIIKKLSSLKKEALAAAA